MQKPFVCIKLFIAITNAPIHVGSPAGSHTPPPGKAPPALQVRVFFGSVLNVKPGSQVYVAFAPISYVAVTVPWSIESFLQ